MSLTPRDTFVRYVDPLRTMWEDAEGNLHFSIPNALKAFGFPDTSEGRKAVAEIFKEAMDMDAIIVDRPAPDTTDYWEQVHPDDRPAEFKHLPYRKPDNA
jgi:hypothetical protein